MVEKDPRHSNRLDLLESTETELQRRDTEPLAVAFTRYLAKNPDVAIALGVGVIAAGATLKALENSNRSSRGTY